MQKLGGFSKLPPFLLFSFALSSALLPHLLAPSSASFPLPPYPDSGAPTSRVHSRTPAPPPISVFCLHPSPLYSNSLFINTQGVNISPTPSPSPSLHLPFTSPLAILPNRLRESPTFSNTSPVFLRHSPSLANCKISHRAGEGIFLKAFTPYALIYCTLRPSGEEVKEKNEKHLTRAREGSLFSIDFTLTLICKRKTNTLNK